MSETSHFSVMSLSFLPSSSTADLLITGFDRARSLEGQVTFSLPLSNVGTHTQVGVHSERLCAFWSPVLTPVRAYVMPVGVPLARGGVFSVRT